MKNQISKPDLTALFNALSSGFIYFTTSGVIGYCNETAASLFNTTPSKMTGTKLTDYPVMFLPAGGAPAPAGEHLLLNACQQKTILLDQLFQLVSRGEERWIRCNIEPIYDVVHDRFDGAVLSFVEATDAIRARLEQKETEEKYRHHFAQNDSATFLATKEGAYLGVSQGAEKLFGYTSTELKAAGRQSIIVQNEAFKKTLKSFCKKGKAVAEVQGLTKKGQTISLLWYASCFRASTGEELVSETVVDISEKKELEHNARLLDFNLQLILENTDESFVLLDEKLHVISFNHASVSVFNDVHNSQLAPGKNIITLINQNYRQELKEVLHEVLAGQSRDLQRVYHLGGAGLRAFQTAFRPLYKNGKTIGIAINSRDITKKYKIQQELLQSNERYRRAALASFDILWEHDLVESRLYFTESFAQAFGYSKPINTLPAQEFASKFIHPDDRERIRKAVRVFIDSGNTHFTYPVHRLLKKDGSAMYVEAQVVASRDEKGHAYLLTGVTRDITERYLMEQRLRESTERYDLVARATSDVVWDWDLRTNVHWMSENFVHQYGYKDYGADLELWKTKLHPDDCERVLAGLTEVLQGQQTTWQAEYRMLKADGTYADVYNRGYILHDAAGRPYRIIGALQNISELKSLQQQMADEQVAVQKKITEATIRSQEAEREELGRELHDNINQILATCKMLIDVSLKNEDMRAELLPKSYGYLNKAIDEIRLLSKSLVPPSLGDIGLTEALEELAQSYTDSWAAAIRITGPHIGKTTFSTHFQLMAYRVVQEQLNNIMKYAKATEVEINFSLLNDVLKITIADNGVGFDAAQKKAGIGLKNIKSRAAFYGGDMVIETLPGQGCVLEVTIPVAAQ